MKPPKEATWVKHAKSQLRKLRERRDDFMLEESSDDDNYNMAICEMDMKIAEIEKILELE